MNIDVAYTAPHEKCFVCGCETREPLGMKIQEFTIDDRDLIKKIVKEKDDFYLQLGIKPGYVILWEGFQRVIPLIIQARGIPMAMFPDTAPDVKILESIIGLPIHWTKRMVVLCI